MLVEMRGWLYGGIPSPPPKKRSAVPYLIEYIQNLFDRLETRRDREWRESNSSNLKHEEQRQLILLLFFLILLIDGVVHWREKATSSIRGWDDDILDDKAQKTMHAISIQIP